MTKRIYLNATLSVNQFSQEREALFDEPETALHLEEEVQHALEEFLPQPPRLRDYSVDYGPACPKCGAHTVKKVNKYGNLFWSCSCWPRCNGCARDEQGLRRATTFLAQEGSSSSSCSTNNYTRRILSLSVEVQEEVKRVVELAIEMHQSKFAALQWLQTKKVGLHMKMPLEVMHSVEGCNIVARLLIQKFEQSEF